MLGTWGGTKESIPCQYRYAVYKCAGAGGNRNLILSVIYEYSPKHKMYHVLFSFIALCSGRGRRNLVFVDASEREPEM
jgi:hypothetical protein